MFGKVLEKVGVLMKSWIDELFSPERLQTDWGKGQDSPEAQDDASTPSAKRKSVRLCYRGSGL